MLLSKSLVQDGVTEKQLYWPETNVLVTRFLCQEGVAELIDYMPVGSIKGAYKPHQVVRRLNVVRGTMHFRLECFPSFDYGRAGHKAEIRTDGAAFPSEERRRKR